jgi:predicted aconitase
VTQPIRQPFQHALKQRASVELLPSDLVLGCHVFQQRRGQGFVALAIESIDDQFQIVDQGAVVEVVAADVFPLLAKKGARSDATVRKSENVATATTTATQLSSAAV